MRHLFLVPAMFMAACSTLPSPTIWNINVDSAQSDAVRAFSAGDKRFLLVNGVAGEVLGIDNDYGLVDAYGYKEIAGTSDQPASADEDRLNRSAVSYSMLYNAKMKSLILGLGR